MLESKSHTISLFTKCAILVFHKHKGPYIISSYGDEPVINNNVATQHLMSTFSNDDSQVFFITSRPFQRPTHFENSSDKFFCIYWNFLIPNDQFMYGSILLYKIGAEELSQTLLLELKPYLEKLIHNFQNSPNNNISDYFLPKSILENANKLCIPNNSEEMLSEHLNTFMARNEEVINITLFNDIPYPLFTLSRFQIDENRSNILTSYVVDIINSYSRLLTDIADTTLNLGEQDYKKFKKQINDMDLTLNYLEYTYSRIKVNNTYIHHILTLLRINISQKIYFLSIAAFQRLPEPRFRQIIDHLLDNIKKEVKV